MIISPLCEFASWFPTLVGHELEVGRREGHQWRETSWTDRMLLELRKLRDPRIITKVSNEVVTGADMDWWFVRADGSRHICLTIQAKILHYGTANQALWAYPELRHPHGSHGRQSRVLTATAMRQTKLGVATYPLYLFYNPASARPVPSLFWPLPCGAMLADGYWVASHLDAHRTGGVIPRSATQLSSVGPLMFGLPQLLCRPSNDIPDPDEVVAALTLRVEALKSRATDKRRAPRRRPEAGDGVPAYIASLIDRARSGQPDRKESDADGPSHNTIVFVSER